MDRIVEISKIRGGESNTVLVNKNQKEIKIKKVDKNGKPIEGVTFLYYYNKKDAIEGKIYTADEIVSDKNGIIKFNILPPAYFFYAREIDAPKKYIISNEIISFYRDNRVRFIGETEVKDLKVNEAKNGQNLNEYLQELISNDELTWFGPREINNDTNWLVFNDNGIEKLIPKKPLKYMLRWSEIENAGLAFGNKIVNINGNDYKIRLMKTFNDNNNSTKNSEWNRLMLPIIGLKGNERDIGGFYWDNNKRLDLNIFPYGRFSLSSENKIEPNDMPVFANYSWWRDFDGYYSRWMLENIPSKEYNRNMCRGMRDWDGAAGAGSEGAASTGIGWQPILESVNSNETK